MKKRAPIYFVFVLLFSFFLQQSCQNKIAKESVAFTKQLPEVIDYNFHVKPILSDRCFNCHGPDENTREAGLRFDTKEGIFAALGKAEDRHAVIPHDVENSTLVQRIYSEDPEDMMPTPESNLSLTDHEKEIFKKWIAQGAKWKQHWSFLPIDSPELPTVNDENWVSNEIDYFVLSKLQQNGLTPSERADKAALLRRVSFDLTGLPPSIKELEDFENDTSPQAYKKVVDRLLNSDAYAEKMTNHWLDLARYADTHGYQDDLERIMWPWRDWVIHAYKENMPYDEFVTWQLAGDLLPNATKEQLIATAFNRNHKITQEGGVIPEEYRVEYVADRTQTFGTAFLGLSFECAKCHDHKYDPISQKDFFSMYAFFNNVPEKGLIEQYGAIPEPYIELTQEEITEQLTFIQNLDTLETIPLMVMEEMEQPRATFVLNRGAYDQPTEEVRPNTPKSVLAFADDYPQNRLGLAKWLFDPTNPLTARVAANRLWQQCFGQGLVGSIGDFGSQGSLPTHPELLDYLATELQKDWDVKALMKTIVLSSTYQQSSKVTPDLLELDPENRLLARAPRSRLSAEMIRDHVLSASGLLVKTVGGPSVKPYQPEGLWAETANGASGSTSKYRLDEGSKLYRRSLYTFWKRTLPPPSMAIFDAPSRELCMVERESTSTPLQALVLMNDPQIIEAARVMAYRSIETTDDLEKRIAWMFRLATSRLPETEEVQELTDYFETEKARLRQDEAAAEAFLDIGQYPQKELLETPELAAYAMTANLIFNLDESISK
ncbi:MAG: PSD1 and planctomycete cytochrome C domain-containing protein [Bacteroidota bacterium]